MLWAAITQAVKDVMRREAAPELATKYANAFGIEIISHNGAAYALTALKLSLQTRCGHAVASLVEISELGIQGKIEEGALYEFADDQLQQILGKIQ